MLNKLISIVIIYNMDTKLLAVSYATYANFAKKYKIKLSKNGKKKPINKLSNEIKLYESTNQIKGGLYFQTNIK